MAKLFLAARAIRIEPSGMAQDYVIDCSGPAGRQDWRALLAEGFTFAIPRLTSGGSTVDMRAGENVHGARGVGVEVPTGYHYIDSRLDGARQVDFALDIAASLCIKNVALDCEPVKVNLDGTYPRPSDAPHFAREVLMSAARRYVEKTNRYPVVYGSPHYLGALKLDPWMAQCPLWVAAYGFTTPPIPAPWQGWILWQKEANRKVSAGVVDVNETPLTPDLLRIVLA